VYPNFIFDHQATVKVHEGKRMRFTVNTIPRTIALLMTLLRMNVKNQLKNTVILEEEYLSTEF
jgi:hypothetical protein